MTQLKKRAWPPTKSEAFVMEIARQTADASEADIHSRIDLLVDHNKRIHERDCFNLNPATNVMNPRAEAMLSSGMGTRPSLGYPGDKYEMGLEAIEEIEIIAAELSAEIFNADYAEIRVPSGAIANLYGFMATCKPGDHIIAPPASIGGHVTHHLDGCAGLFGLVTHPAPVYTDGYTIDLDGLRRLAHEINPTLITIGGSLNLFEHPVADIRTIADEVSAYTLFDAAHQCGIIAGKAWKNPLSEGAHMMTMSTYKSLGGPPSGLIVTNDTALAEKLDAIAFPGMTANFDAAKSASLAITMLDWRTYGSEYAAKMISVAQALAKSMSDIGLPVFARQQGFTASHQFALEAAQFGGGQAAAKKLRQAGILTCGIGLPIAEVPGDMNGLRFGTPELVRWGVQESDAPRLASLVAKALTSNDPARIADEVAEWRQTFDQLHFIRPG